MSSQWKKVAYLAVGGLTEVGFAAGSLLLVVSHQGHGVVGLASEELLARDRQETGARFGAARRTVLGTGQLDGAWISVCGLADDVWSVHRTPVSGSRCETGRALIMQIRVLVGADWRPGVVRAELVHVASLPVRAAR